MSPRFIPALLLPALLLMPPVLRAAPASVHQGSGPGYAQIQSLQARAQAALDAGNYVSASALGRQLLHENTDKTSWNYGNVVYDGNQIVGLAELKLGHLDAAKSRLLAAGRTPGSPQLDSFGPEMKLAQALLAKGQKQTVLTFLDSIGKFWAVAPPRMQKYHALYEDHAALLTHWKNAIRAGKPASLNRFDSAGSQAETAPRPALLAPGTVAPDFTAQDPAGKPVHLSDYKGKVVVLDLWATWCPPCQASLPHTNAVAKEFAPKGAVVLAVCVSDTKPNFDGWLPKHPEYDAITFAFDPSGRSKPSEVNKLYHVSGIPTQYVIGKDGKIVTSFVGYGGPTSDLSDALTKATAAP